MNMKVGYARIDITPQESVPLGGYGNSKDRMSEVVLDPLYATCVAFVNEAGEKALVCTVDLLNAGVNTTTEVRPAISEATGIPVDYIQVSGTHSHASPDMLSDLECMARYLEFYKQQMVKVALAALEDIKPAALELTRTTTKNLNFVRHYLMADGTYAGPNFGNHKQPYVAHETDADPVMQLARIKREGGKDVVLCNFGVHQTNTGGQLKHDISADIAGAMRAEYEARSDRHFAYFTAACGNVNPVSSIAEENIVPDHDHVAHGKALAQYALDADGSFVPASFGAIKAASKDCVQPINHTTDHLVPQAKEVWDLFTSTNDRALANAMGKEKYGFSSVYHANAIVNRSQMPESDTVTINALTVGDLAFAVAPYEMYDTNGMEIKQGSPYKMTFVLTLGNQQSWGYFPTKLSFEHGGYAADTCRFMPGIGEDISSAFVKLLGEL
ncbi:MAG: hypothetical protein IJP02_00985 [Oscillospiraceae bacterium]|nr:hypothetical protein [Oscillospiraceae bacterium]